MSENWGVKVTEVRSTLFAGERAVCPCCDRPIQIEKVRWNWNLIAWCVWFKFMYDNGHPDWLHVPSVAAKWQINDRSYHDLRYHGLIEQNTKGSGLWRLTNRGRLFAQDIGLVAPEVGVLSGELVARNRENEHYTLSDVARSVDCDIDDLMKTFAELYDEGENTDVPVNGSNTLQS